MPAGADTRIAFLLVQHLAPDHKSILAELVGRYTRLKVLEAGDGMRVKPGCVYVIPPNRDMALLNGALQLFEPAAGGGPRLPIDFLFRSLAEDQGEGAIGIVLSGTGSDGTLGLREIKGGGGLTLAQAPETAEYDGMPRSAIAAGQADFVLAPAEMPARLIAYEGRAFGKKPLAAPAEVPPEDLLKKIFILLRARAGNDFSQYKRNTILRRIERRMAIRQLESLDAYVKYLQKNQPEQDALFADLLIGVTKFFRDPKEFKALEDALAGQVFAGKPEGYLVRVWVPGCSTGEEAYSLAILMAELQERLKPGLQVQIFATDIDHRAIEAARAGVYPAGIAEDLTPERLSRFFTAEPGGMAYRVNKKIRDMMVFSEQNALKDPPFSKLDLVSCRNLLIYLGNELQEKLLPLFHYALNPRGILFLGTAESVGACDKFFEPLSYKAKIYRRKEPAGGGLIPGAGRFALPPSGGAFSAQRAGLQPVTRRSTLRELAEKAILQQRGLAAALTDERGEILYLHGRSGRYLEPSPGEVGMNILKMAREGLRAPLAGALQAAAAKEEPVRHPGLRVKTNGDFTWVDLTVQQVKDTPEPGQRLFLVTLEAAPAPAEAPPAAGAGDTTDLDRRVAALQEELRAKEESLETANAGLADLNEELMSANEELQSANEELQSTNEELSTSTEELQSINEELSTVNAEQQAKVDKLARANNDMINLMASTGIGTIFVDEKLRVMRFTPAAARIVNLIGSDEGRPLAHLVSNLVDYTTLVGDTREVLETLVPKDIEVRAGTGEWFLLRIRPYRTVENVIEGAAITFVEITELKKAQESSARLAVVLRDSGDAVTVHDLEGRILAWNPAAERAYGWSEAEALAVNIRDLVPEDQRETALARIKQLSRAEVLKPYRAKKICKDGHSVEAWVAATALKDQAGKVYAISTTERIIEKG